MKNNTIDKFPPPAELPTFPRLPDPFARLDGEKVSSRDEWQGHRRYLKKMLAYYQYGRIPGKPSSTSVRLTRSGEVLGGDGFGRWWEITISRGGDSVSMSASLITPSGNGPFPVIVKNDRVPYLLEEGELPGDYPDAVRKGIRTDEEVLPEAIKRGYAMCKFVRTDLAKDQRGTRSEGVFPLYPEFDWGAIAAWGWGYSLVLDALEEVEEVDDDRVVATGHSRGGKAALCGSVYEERIAIAAPNSSGTGGTGSLRCFEEGREPHQRLEEHVGICDRWWGPRFLEFAGMEERLPFDAHTAKALIAPRPLVNPHATGDFWANPYGTELTHRAAGLVYDWLGAGKKIAMHWREGEHAQGREDWHALMDFADRHFFGASTERPFDVLAYPEEPLNINWSPPPE